MTPTLAEGISDKIRKWSKYATILSISDREEAKRIITQQIETLEILAQSKEGEANTAPHESADNLGRMRWELEGGRKQTGVAQRKPGPLGVRNIVLATSHASNYLGGKSVEILYGNVWNWVVTTCSLSDYEREAAAKYILESLTNLNSEVACRLAKKISYDLYTLLDEARVDEFLMHAAYTFNCQGMGKVAEIFYEQIRKPDKKQRVRNNIDLFNKYHSLNDLSLLEKMMFEYGTVEHLKGHTAFITNLIRDAKQESEQTYLTLDTFFIILSEEYGSRHAILDLIPILVLPIVSIWGPDAAYDMVNLIEDFDSRLLDAAKKLGEFELRSD